LRRRSFGPISAGRRPSWVASVQASVDAGVMIGAFDGGRLVGTARYHQMRQWWHGRSMSMAGRYETVLPARALTALANPDQPAAAGQGGAPKLRRATPADGAAIVAD